MGTSLIDANYGRSLFVASSVVASTPLALTATPIAGVNPLNVAIVDGSGAQIISFGGGSVTQGTSPWVTQQSATLAVTPARVAIAASSSGDNTLISAQGTGKKIYVYAFELSFSGTVNAKFTDGASGTNLGGLYYGVANAGAADSTALPGYLWVGSANTALILNLSGATAVGGGVSYFVI